MELWAEDEARLGLKPILRRVWTPRAERPQAQVRQRYEWLYVFGFVQPKSGESQWWLLGGVSTEAFSAVLGEFAQSPWVPECRSRCSCSSTARDGT